MSDGIALVRTLGALLTVLGFLAGALWVVRRYNLALPGTGLARHDKRLAVVERLNLDPRRSLVLIRRDDIEHLVMLSPEGLLVIESTITGATPALAKPAPRAGATAPAASVVHNFSALLEQTLRRRVVAPVSAGSERGGAGRRGAGPHV